MTSLNIDSEWDFMIKEINSLNKSNYCYMKRELLFTLQLILCKISEEHVIEDCCLNEAIYLKGKSLFLSI
jgi:hypothetical protein